MISSVSRQKFSFSPTCKKTGALPASQWNVFHLHSQSLSTVHVRNSCQGWERRMLPSGCLFLLTPCLGFPTLPLSGRSDPTCFQVTFPFHCLRPPDLCPSAPPRARCLVRTHLRPSLQLGPRHSGLVFSVCVWVRIPHEAVSPAVLHDIIAVNVHGRIRPTPSLELPLLVLNALLQAHVWPTEGELVPPAQVPEPLLVQLCRGISSFSTVGEVHPCSFVHLSHALEPPERSPVPL